MIDQNQINVFIDSLTRYFNHLDLTFADRDDKLEVSAPYLLKGEESIGLDYTGMINVSGSKFGTVLVSARSALLKRILLSYGESDLSAELKRDLIGEVANTLAGNARRHLGEDFHISTPRVFEGPINLQTYRLSNRCFALPFRWRSNKAELIVSINDGN